MGAKIDSVVTVNGVRVTLEDGTWSAPLPTSLRSSSWSKAPYPKTGCVTCSEKSKKSFIVC